jgi:hypothetical protein
MEKIMNIFQEIYKKHYSLLSDFNDWVAFEYMFFFEVTDGHFKYTSEDAIRCHECNEIVEQEFEIDDRIILNMLPEFFEEQGIDIYFISKSQAQIFYSSNDIETDFESVNCNDSRIELLKEVCRKSFDVWSKKIKFAKK